MSDYDQWLERQAGCYDEQGPACDICGYEFCDHGVCRYCLVCDACDAEEEVDRAVRKPPASTPIAPVKDRKTG
jgi:hypothetical protein